MVTCKRCDAHVLDPRDCSYCGNTYCPDHRLPENHDCSGVKGLNAVGKPFETGFDRST